MNIMSRLTPRLPGQRFLLTLAAGTLCTLLAHADASLYLGSKSTYTPQQDPATYEAAPAGFAPVFTQIVARHGSRGLSSASNDLALYDMWSKANAAGALTKLGQRLGPDLQRITRANALLGYGVAGISAPGYGNLTQVGIEEHRQLAVRLAARVAPLLSGAVAQAQVTPRQVVVSNSGVNRAIDSANFFTQSLANAVPGLAPYIVRSAALTAYPVNAPKPQAAGTNRFQLYFHKLTAGTDLPATTDAYYPVYQSSLAYQSYLAGDQTMLNKVNGVVYGDSTKAVSRAVLETVFTKPFVDALDAGTTRYANVGSYTFTSDDGLFTTTVTGDGGTRIANLVDAANSLYAVYSITPAMAAEVPVNLGKYIPDAALQTLAYVSDAQDFYQKGPGIAEAGSINSAMSQALLNDFFAEVDAIAAGNRDHHSLCHPAGPAVGIHRRAGGTDLHLGRQPVARRKGGAAGRQCAVGRGAQCGQPVAREDVLQRAGDRLPAGLRGVPLFRRQHQPLVRVQPAAGLLRHGRRVVAPAPSFTLTSQDPHEDHCIRRRAGAGAGPGPGPGHQRPGRHQPGGQRQFRSRSRRPGQLQRLADRVRGCCHLRGQQRPDRPASRPGQ
jgi:hypothetical protein